MESKDLHCHCAWLCLVASNSLDASEPLWLFPAARDQHPLPRFLACAWSPSIDWLSYHIDWLCFCSEPGSSISVSCWRVPEGHFQNPYVLEQNMLENLLDFFRALTNIPLRLFTGGKWGAVHKSLHYHCMHMFHISLPWVFACVSILSIIVCE